MLQQSTPGINSSLCLQGNATSVLVLTQWGQREDPGLHVELVEAHLVNALAACWLLMVLRVDLLENHKENA